MKPKQEVGELSPRGQAMLFGVMALCCVVPMLVVVGALSLTGALFGGAVAVVVAAIAMIAWTAWMRRHSCQMSGHGESVSHGGCCGGHDPVHTEEQTPHRH